MAVKPQKLLTLSAEHKEALAKIASLPEYKSFIQLLRTERDNIAVLEWSRIDYADPLIAQKKAYFQGRVDELKNIITAFEEVKKDADTG